MIIDYVKEYGNTSFADEPINYVDLLVLTELAYLDWPQECWGNPFPQALAQATEPVIVGEGNSKIVAMDVKRDLELAQIVAGASRYAAGSVREFKSIYKKDVQQFAALSLLMDDVLIVIFRGTDESVTGWEEALKLSLDKPVASHQDAIRFLEEQADKTEMPIIVCGHSKGGNLAEYAATIAVSDEPALADRIAAIVSFDGPGLPPWLRKTPAYKAIADRIRTFIPKSSIVGNIHEHPDGAVIYIDADGKFTAQHRIFNWKTSGTHLVAIDQSAAGIIGSGALNLLIDNLNDACKNAIFKALFALPKAKGKQLL